MGATVIFADIDPESWCLSAESFEACISPNTRAVIPVDLYGNLPDMDTIEQIASKHNIMVVEDAAQAIGSEYNGRKSGSFGVAGVFSFHGTKTMTTGEGGMLVLDDSEIHDRCQFLANHGRACGEKIFWNTKIAYKYKMSGMQAALGLAQLERIEELIHRKRKIFSWYQKLLGDVECITINSEIPAIKNTYWMTTVVIDTSSGLPKEQIIKEMAEKGISCRPFFYPLSSLPAYKKLPQAKQAFERNLNAYRISPYGVNLPSGLNMTEKDVTCVCRSLLEIIEGD